MDAGVSYFGLIILVLVGLLAIGGIVGVVALLAHPKTRAAGGVVLAVGLMVLVVGGLLVFGFWGFSVDLTIWTAPTLVIVDEFAAG